MDPIHPHWQSSNGEQSSSKNVATSSGTKIPIASQAAQRKPAALVGVGIALLLIGGFAGGVQHLRAQLSSSDREVRITAQGLLPKSISVTPGQEIIWINEHDTPHILSSNTFQTTEGTLYTKAIFPGSSYSAVVSDSAKPGSYPYFSLTSEDISGDIVVKGNEEDTPPPPPVTQFVPDKRDVPPSALPPTPPLPLGSQGAGIPTQQTPPPLQPQSRPPSSRVIVERNPYALIGGVIAPSMPSGQPLSAPGTPRPFRQPASGPGLWVVLFLSLGILLLFARRALSTLKR